MLQTTTPTIQGKTMNEQKTILEKTFLDWKKNSEQVDDVIVFGFQSQP